MSDKEMNGWAEWSKYVLLELKRLNETIEEIGKHNRQVENDLIQLSRDFGNRGKDCIRHQGELHCLRKDVDKTTGTHRMIAVAISSLTSIIVAGITGYFVAHKLIG